MTENFANRAQSLLNGSIDSDDTTLVVDDASGFPAANFRILIDDELMLVTEVSTNTFTVTREIEGTSADSHSDNATVTHVLTAGSLQEAATQGGWETWDDVMTDLAPVHRWMFEETSGFPQDSVASLHMTTGGGTITREVSAPLGKAFQITADMNGSGNGSAPMGNNPRSIVGIWRPDSGTASARTIISWGPTNNTRQWNHCCANHDNFSQGPCYLFWSDDHKPGNSWTSGAWHMAVWQYESRAAKIWMDGEITNVSSTGANINTVNSGNLLFGGNGIFDDFSIFDYWLSQQEITRLWDAVKGTALRRLQTPKGVHHVYALAFAPDGTRLAHAGGVGIVIWDGTPYKSEEKHTAPEAGR